MSAFEAGAAVAVVVSFGGAVGGAVAEALGAGEEVGCMLLVGGVGEFGVGGG